MRNHIQRKRIRYICTGAILFFVAAAVIWPLVRAVERDRATQALVKAVENGQVASVRELLAAGADPNTWSHQRAEVSWFELLTDMFRGRDRTVHRGAQPAVLHLAIQRGDVEMARLLLQAGADPNARTGNAEPPLLAAARDGNAALCRLLLDHGADIDAQQERKSTALMLAAGYGRKDVVSLLLSRGATVNMKNSYGWSALYYAADNRQPDTITLLKAAGAQR